MITLQVEPYNATFGYDFEDGTFYISILWKQYFFKALHRHQASNNKVYVHNSISTEMSDRTL